MRHKTTSLAALIRVSHDRKEGYLDAVRNAAILVGKDKFKLTEDQWAEISQQYKLDTPPIDRPAVIWRKKGCKHCQPIVVPVKLNQ